ncbi:helix-turn-helix domain-containing protein [Haloferacaceae archaeon DSL9]
MDSGIYVQVDATGVDACPVTSMSETAEIESVVTGQRTDAHEATTVGEVTLARQPDGGHLPDAATEVFSNGTRSVYRFTSGGDGCPCARVPAHGCPIRSANADSGTLNLSFIAPSVETLRTIIDDLQSCCDTVRVRRLTRSEADGTQALFVVERAAFTDRQYEVLRTAHEMGYFERPKAANSAAVASELDITTATFSDHLAAAQTKLLDQLLSA